MKAQRTENERLGYVKVVAVEGVYHFRRNEYDALLACWRSAKQNENAEMIYEGEDNYGTQVAIDVSSIESVLDISAQALQHSTDDEQLVTLRDGDTAA